MQEKARTDKMVSSSLKGIDQLITRVAENLFDFLSSGEYTVRDR